MNARPMIRPARPEDTEAVCRLVHDAYAHYVERLGKLPGPMLDDYDRRIAAGQAWVLEDGGTVAGVLVLEDAEGAAPCSWTMWRLPRPPKARGTGGRWWRSRRKRRADAGAIKYGSTRTC